MRQHGLVHGRNTPLQTLRTETNLKSLADGDMMADTKRQTRTDADPKFWNPHIPGYHPSSKDDVTKLSPWMAGLCRHVYQLGSVTCRLPLAAAKREMHSGANESQKLWKNSA